MGFSKIFLQDVKKLKENYEADKTLFKHLMRKAEFFIGSPESIKFVEDILSEKETIKTDETPKKV